MRTFVRNVAFVVAMGLIGGTAWAQRVDGGVRLNGAMQGTSLNNPIFTGQWTVNLVLCAAGTVLQGGNPTTCTASPTLTGLTVDSPTFFVDSTNHRVGFGTVTPAHFLDVVAGTMPSSTIRLFNFTGTMPATTSGTATTGVNWAITSPANATASSRTFGFGVSLAAGYTGTSNTIAGRFSNSAVSTGRLPYAFASGGAGFAAGNFGVLGNVTSASTGAGIGLVGSADTSAYGYGIWGQGLSTTNTGVGVVGYSGNNSTVNIGGLFWLNSAGISVASGNLDNAQSASAVIVADNGNVAAPIALFKNNGTTVASITQTGGIDTTTAFSISATPITSGTTLLTSGSGMAVANVGANSCGTTTATIAGNNNLFTVTVGATSGSQCRVAFTVTAGTTWGCGAPNDETTAGKIIQAVPVDTTHVDLVGAFVAGDKVTAVCFPR